MGPSHPSERGPSFIKKIYMKRLENKVIYYVPTGARSSQYADEIILELIEEGASVFTIPTKASLDFFDIKKIKSIKGNSIKTDWKNKLHLPKEDAVLIAPCTANTLNSMAAGITNTYPLCIIASAIGNKTPIFIAPSMNKSLWYHPMVQENIKKLEKWDCRIIWPKITPEIISIADIGKILDALYFSFKRINYNDQKIKTNKDYKTLVKRNFEIFKEIGSYLAKKNINLPTAGCLSMKVNQGFLITTSGSDMAILKEEDISYITSWDEKKCLITWMGEKVPSSEAPLHCVLHQNRSDMLILHFHCPELTYSHKLSHLNTEDYIRYGTFKIGHESVKMVEKNNFMILKLHGEIVIGENTSQLKRIIAKHRKMASVN